MRRVPEPEALMDDPAQAAAYAAADFAEPNALFVRLLHRLLPAGASGRALDLGCGPADIPVALVREFPELRIDAIDGAQAMLALARRRVEADPVARGRVRLHRVRLPHDPLPGADYDLLLSNSLLHHLEDPCDLWRTLRRAGRPGAAVLVMDLARPESALAVDALVETHAIDAPEVLRRDFRNSLRAAWTPEEVRDQLVACGLGRLELHRVSDRHWAVSGRLPES